MCGAFEQHNKAMHRWAVILDDWPADADRRINIRPTMIAGTIDAEGYHERSWSLIPSWAKEATLKFSTFNARAETITEKATYRQPWRKSQRCIVPASAYFEWPTIDGKKQCRRLTQEGGSPWLMAGLWEQWMNGDDSRNSFAVITTSSVQQIEWVHNRMPLIINPDDLDCWLTGSPEDAEALLAKKSTTKIDVVPGDPKSPPDTN